MADTSAPAWRSMMTTAALPALAALCRGVVPSLQQARALAPRLSSACAISALPRQQASCSGDQPSSFCACGVPLVQYVHIYCRTCSMHAHQHGASVAPVLCLRCPGSRPQAAPSTRHKSAHATCPDATSVQPLLRCRGMSRACQVHV